jgi:hypothetical protein
MRNNEIRREWTTLEVLNVTYVMSVGDPLVIVTRQNDNQPRPNIGQHLYVNWLTSFSKANFETSWLGINLKMWKGDGRDL